MLESNLLSPMASHIRIEAQELLSCILGIKLSSNTTLYISTTSTRYNFSLVF